jgi:hypothetical protein
VLAISGICLSASALGEETAPCSSTVQVVDNIKQISNPATPAGLTRTLKPQRIWSYSLDEDDQTLPLIGFITQVIQSGDDSIYMLDTQTEQVLEFSISKGYVGVLSRSGEGPGEVMKPIDMAPMPDGRIAVAKQTPGELLLLDCQGSHDTKEIELTGEGIIGFVTLDKVARLPNGFAVRGSAMRVVDSNQEVCAFLSIVNEDGIGHANILTKCTALAKLATGEGLKEIGDVSQTILVCGKSLYLVKNPDEYAITVYSPEGEVQHVIRREFTRRRYTEEERDEIRAVWDEMKEKVPLAGSIFDEEPPEFAPSIMSMVARGNGQLWVLPDRDTEPETGSPLMVYDVFDNQGCYIEQVRIENDELGQPEAIYLLEDCIVTLRGLTNRLPGAEIPEDEDAGNIQIGCYRFE